MKYLDKDVAKQLMGSVENTVLLNNIFQSTRVYSIKNSTLNEVSGGQNFFDQVPLEIFLNMCDFQYIPITCNANNRKRVQVKIILLVGAKRYPLLYQDPLGDSTYNVFAYTRLMTQQYNPKRNVARQYIQGLGKDPIYLSGIKFLGYERERGNLNLCFLAYSNKTIEIADKYCNNYSICTNKSYVESLLLQNNEISAKVAYKYGFQLP